MMLLNPVLQLCVAMATAQLAAMQWWYTTFGCLSVLRARLMFAVTEEDHHGAMKYFLLLRMWRHCHI